MAEERLCPTCGDTNLVLTADKPVDGWNELSCKSCHRVLEIGRPGVGPLVDPLWVDRHSGPTFANVERWIVDYFEAAGGNVEQEGLEWFLSLYDDGRSISLTSLAASLFSQDAPRDGGDRPDSG